MCFKAFHLQKIYRQIAPPSVKSDDKMASNASDRQISNGLEHLRLADKWYTFLIF